MTAREVVTTLLLLGGALFFVAGTVGLLRFPDARSRLHALAKADNLGLGLVAIGLALGADSLATAVKLLVIWLFALVGSAVMTYQVARRSLRDDGEPAPPAGRAAHAADG